MIQQIAGLSPAEVEHFHNQGYLICHRQLFPTEKFQRLQQAFERLGVKP